MKAVVAAAQEKKAKNIVSLDLSGFDGAIADAFVICNAESTTHVASIADGIEELVHEATGEWPRRVEGMNNAVWVVVDYVDVMVHIFQTEAREFYKLQQLWADAPLTKYESEE